MTRAAPLLGRHLSSSTAPCVVAVGNQCVTVDQLRRQVAAVAARLPPPRGGAEVLVVSSDRHHFVVGLLAAWMRGHPVALPPNTRDALLREFEARTDIAALLHDADEDVGLRIDHVIAASEAGGTEPAPDDLATFGLEHFGYDDPLVSVWTSGSTGEHRRHRKTREQLLGEANALCERFAIDAGTTFVATVPSHHIYGLLFGVLVPLVSGGCYLRDTVLHASAVAAQLRRVQTAGPRGLPILVSVPAHLMALTTLTKQEFPRLQRIFSSGAPLPETTSAHFAGPLDQPITEVLGSTETGGIASRQHGEAWCPLPGVEVACGEHGELVVCSPFTSRTAMTTGDRIEISSRNPVRFRHLGRVDGVVKVGGKRVSLREVERRLLDIAGVEEAAAVALEVGGARHHEIAALVVAPGISGPRLRAELTRWLDPVVVPRRIQHLDALPRQASGKLARADLVAALGRPTARLPLVEPSEAEGTDEQRCFRVRFPKDLVTLRGHFPRDAIVAGVVQLDLAWRLARAQWQDLGTLRRVLRLKFKQPLRAGDAVDLTLQRVDRPGGAARVSFRYCDLDATGDVATGTLEWGSTTSTTSTTSTQGGR